MVNPNRKGSYRKMIPGLIGAHALAMIISIVTCSLLGRFENSYITFAMYVICLGFGLFFVYHEGWIAGSSDKTYISNGQIALDNFRGVKAGVYASGLNFAIALLGFLSRITPLGNITLLDTSMFELIYRLWFWAYSGMYAFIDVMPWLHFLPLAAMPLACGVGYFLGVKHIRLADYLFYKRDN